MCYPVNCPACGKTTWDGCGQHVDNVRNSVPASEWCTCRDGDTPKARTGVFGSLFGR